MKTTTDLNSKIWYRALKSLYILSLIIFIIFSVIGAYDQHKKIISIDNNNTKIICNNGRTLSTNQAEVYFYSTNFGRITSNKIQENCQWFEGKYLQGKDYKVDFKYSETGGLNKIILYSFVYIIILVLIYEISRRIFYYIILGTIKPKK